MVQECIRNKTIQNVRIYLWKVFKFCPGAVKTNESAPAHTMTDSGRTITTEMDEISLFHRKVGNSGKET